MTYISPFYVTEARVGSTDNYSRRNIMHHGSIVIIEILVFSDWDETGRNLLLLPTAVIVGTSVPVRTLSETPLPREWKLPSISQSTLPGAYCDLYDSCLSRLDFR